MLKLKQRSCNKLKTILHGKVIFVCNSCLDSQIQIPTLFGVCFFFLLSTLFSVSLINASIYSSFVLNYLPSRMLAVFALCHSLGGAFANFDATRGLGICQPRGPRPPLGSSYDHGTQIQLNIEDTKRFFFLQILLKKYIEQQVLRIAAFLPFTLRQMAVHFFFRQQYSRSP